MSYNPFANYPAAPVMGDHSTPQSAVYTGTSDSYSKFHSPADPNARLNLIHAESHRAAFDASMAEQSSIYTPEAASKGGYKHHAGKGKARTTVLRKGGGELWEDSSLMEWDPSQSQPHTTNSLCSDSTFAEHFRLFIGDLDPALSDDLFTAAFANARYPSFVKAKIIRDKYTNKGKGFGFVSYSDPQDFLKAWKEIDGASHHSLRLRSSILTQIRRNLRRNSTGQNLESDDWSSRRRHRKQEGAHARREDESQDWNRSVREGQGSHRRNGRAEQRAQWEWRWIRS